jgi:hypothetical protein
LATAAAVCAFAAPAHAVQATAATLYSLPSTTACTKAHTNCVLYPKAAALPDGRLVSAFEESTVTSAGSAAGQTIPIYKSDDNGATWQYLTGVKAPAYASSNSAYAKYVSNWTNPYLYVLPSAVGSLASGTLMMASVVSGDDYYYLDQVKANGSYTPTHDGDRSNTAIALYASTDNGATWTFENIIATGGWSNGYSYPATENTYKQNDPVWEPYLMVYNGELVCYYSDENDYIGYNTSTGVPTIDPNNATNGEEHAGHDQCRAGDHAGSGGRLVGVEGPVGAAGRRDDRRAGQLRRVREQLRLGQLRRGRILGPGVLELPLQPGARRPDVHAVLGPGALTKAGVPQYFKQLSAIRGRL